MRPADLVERDLRLGLECDILRHLRLQPRPSANTADTPPGRLASWLASDNVTATWQFACLPSWPQYWCDTPTECRPFLGKARVVDDKGLDRSVTLDLRQHLLTHFAQHVAVTPT